MQLISNNAAYNGRHAGPQNSAPSSLASSSSRRQVSGKCSSAVTSTSPLTGATVSDGEGRHALKRSDSDSRTVGGHLSSKAESVGVKRPRLYGLLDSDEEGAE